MNHLPHSTQTILLSSQSLPTNYIHALKPWFTRETLIQGLALLQKKHVSFFIFHRRFAGFLVNDNVTVSVQMGRKANRLPFVFRDGNCSKCGWQQGGGNCEHIAALALVCLQKSNGTLHTLADSFVDSPWHSIGKYLYEQTTMRRSIDIEIQPHADGMLFHGVSKNGLSVKIVLAKNAVDELAVLFPAIHKLINNSPGNVNKSLQNLTSELTKQAASKNEKSLNKNGMRSKQQNIDSSLWAYLAHLLFLHFPVEKLQIKQDGSKAYILYYRVANQTLFSVRLAREHTWELLNKLSLPDVAVHIERAEQFSRVSFVENSADIEIVHCCRLGDETEYTLADIATNRYGNRYQIEDTVFTLKSVPAGEQLYRTQQKQLSLFATIEENGAEDEYGFLVKEKNVTQFIKSNQHKLCCERHQVADTILNMKVVSLPNELILDDYKEDKDWCYLAGWYGMGNHKISLNELLLAVDAGKTLLPGQTWLDIKNSPLAWFHELGTSRLVGKDGRIKVTRGEFLALSSQIGKITTQTKEISGTLAAFLQTDDTVVPLKTKPASHLRSYQRHGCNWLYQLQHYQLGGILADDMGLGKTHQALALIDLLVDTKNRFLIVCPAAVLYHWPEKQNSFFPQLSLSVYHGSGRHLDTALKKQIIVTSYGVMRQDAEMLGEHTFRLLLFDEMHLLKNKKTATHAAVSLLHADTIIGLTGTPVENRVQELETLLGICLPEIFTAAPVRQQFKRAENKEQRQRLQQLVAPFILRRTREQVLTELPACSEDIRICELSPDQIEVYREATDQAQDMVEELLDSNQQSGFVTILATIIRLKQICNHLCQLEQSTDYTLYKSGKWDEFTSLISQCMKSGLKVVVFSQFTAMLDIIERWLDDTQTGFVAIRGSVAAKERNRRVKLFNSDKDCKICCASLLAGGTGIDLTGAQVVIHYDRWWNPAKEEQATARVHRMGQKYPVQVYKLVTAGTLEEKIHGMIEKKRAIAADLIAEDDGSVLKTLSREELAGLFQF